MTGPVGVGMRVGAAVALIISAAVGVAFRVSAVVARSEGPSTLACHGSVIGHPLNKPIVDIASTPDHDGYWLVAADGGIFSFGDAQFYGSTGSMTLNQPVVGMAPTPDGQGYWLVAADGGIFSFGDAQFYGSAGSMTLNQPVVGMAPTPDGQGYWLVAADGGIFSFGDAQFYGSAGSMTLNQPIIAMAATADGSGYWLAAADGGIFSFGTAVYLGSGPRRDPGVGDFVAFVVTTDDAGYILGNANRAIELLAFGDARYAGVGFSPTDDSRLVGLTQPVASADFAYWDATAAGGVELNNPGPAIGLGSQTAC